MGETVACAAAVPHMYIEPYTQVQCCPPFRQLYSDFGDLIVEFVIS